VFKEAGAWFWTHVVAAILIIWTDSNGTLEMAIGIYQEPIEEEDFQPYPIEEESIDSTWILPDNLKRN
jgi:hypothetical protein